MFRLFVADNNTLRSLGFRLLPRTVSTCSGGFKLEPRTKCVVYFGPPNFPPDPHKLVPGVGYPPEILVEHLSLQEYYSGKGLQDFNGKNHNYPLPQCLLR